MKRNLRCFILVFLLSSEVAAEDFQWEFEDTYRDRMLYLHAFMNYQLDAFWQWEWEQSYFSRHGFRLTVGSVTTDELLVDGQLVINQDLGGGWRFRGRGTFYATHHLNSGERSSFMGFERTLYKNLAIFLLANPDYDKENTDASMGVLLTSQNREKYVRLAFITEDFVYQEKNDRGGISLKSPYALEWFLRYGSGKWWVYSGGKLSTGFERQYPDKEASPEIDYHQQQINHFTAKLYYLPADSSIIAMNFAYYQFEEAQNFTVPAQDYEYANTLYDTSIEFIAPFKRYNRFRLLSHYIHQSAQSREYSAHDFERNDLLMGLFYERFLSRHKIDLGYMFSLFEWDYKGFSGQDNYARDGYVDKIKLGWTYAFKNQARLQISISHQLNIGGFGGANLQYLMFF